jgi:hypothetical protein
VTLCAADCVGSPDIDTFEHNTGAQMKYTCKAGRRLAYPVIRGGRAPLGTEAE